MIKINATTHTKMTDGTNGLTISSGCVLDINPHFISERIYDKEGVYVRVQHSISFGVAIYKSLASFESRNEVVVNNEIKEYNISFIAKYIDVKTLTTSAIFSLLQTHIENGDANFSGVGSGKTEIVWPSNN